VTAGCTGKEDCYRGDCCEVKGFCGDFYFRDGLQDRGVGEI